MFDNVYRRSVLGIAGAAPVERLLKRLGFRIGVGRFVAGENLDAALPVLHKLHAAGFTTVLDVLGEFVENRESVDDMMNAILQTVDTLGRQPPGQQLSVKPTQLGLGLSPDLALSNAREIARRAGRAGVHVCLDMENHPYTDGTLTLFSTLQEEGYRELSTVLQSYLRRSVGDLERMAASYPQAQVRIVKGAYKEPETEAFRDAETIHAKFLELTRLALEAGMQVNVATHDEKLIGDVLRQVRELCPDGSGCEFQLLYGIKPRLQERLLADGHAVRVYVPFGQDWYGYFSRRLAERPANLGLVLRGLLG